MLDLLSEQIDDPFFLDLVHRFLTTPIETANGTDLTNTEVGIVQGAVLSPALMNIIIHPLDLFATELCKRGGTYYGRYCDDISIGTKGRRGSPLNKLNNLKEIDLWGYRYGHESFGIVPSF